MNRAMYLALALQVALASKVSSDDSQCDAAVMLQSQKQVKAHDMQTNAGPIETFTFKVTPSDFLNSVALTVAVKDLDGSILSDGDLLVFVGDNLQGVQGTPIDIQPNFPGDYAGEKLYDIMVYGKGPITDPLAQTTTMGDDGKPMTFSFLSHNGVLLTLKPELEAETSETVFKADSRGCEKKADGSIKKVNHITPLVLKAVRHCKSEDATPEEMDAFMTKHFPAYVHFHFTCDQLLGWSNCALVPGMCDKTCPCP
jgi:hypothetical protein